ncbi:MAG: polymer-forming cytoskeletal protein [Spirochaetia bacterium]|nr:polymer-forming cytoskeletal protein [Spirochaetia bacterium]
MRDVVVNTLLGPDSSFRGDLVVDGFVRVDGDMRGSIRTTGKIIVSELARCDASIIARSAVIGGVVRGDVCVLERLTILDGGVIVGNVFAPKLDADGEVLIHGDIEVSGRLEGAEEALMAFLGRHDGTLRTFQPDSARIQDGRFPWVALPAEAVPVGAESVDPKATRPGPWQR